MSKSEYLKLADTIAAEIADGTLRTGDRLEVETPGGGGWGRTAERAAAAIELDLAEGLITPAAARQIYGYQRSSVAATAAE